jgi:hypothetical protein
MRLRVLWAAAVFPAGLWAGSVYLPGNNTLFAFSSNQFTVTGCGSPCSVDGSTSPLPSNPAYMVTWIFQFANPISYSTDPSGQSGDFLLGTVASPGSFTLADDDGGSVVGDLIASPAPSWTSSAGDGTTLSFDIELSSSAIPGGDPLTNLLGSALGAMPQTGELWAVQLNASCANDSAFVQCMGAVPDPSGSITSAAITGSAQPQAPEPGTMALLAGGIAAIAIRRRIGRRGYFVQ